METSHYRKYANSQQNKLRPRCYRYYHMHIKFRFSPQFLVKLTNVVNPHVTISYGAILFDTQTFQNTAFYQVLKVF